MYDELWLEAGIIISRVKQGYEATLIHDTESEHLRISFGSAALHNERVTFDANGCPFEYAKSTYRGDRCRAAISLHCYPHSIICFEIPQLA